MPSVEIFVIAPSAPWSVSLSSCVALPHVPASKVASLVVALDDAIAAESAAMFAVWSSLTNTAIVSPIIAWLNDSSAIPTVSSNGPALTPTPGVVEERLILSPATIGPLPRLILTGTRPASATGYPPYPELSGPLPSKNPGAVETIPSNGRPLP